MMSRSPILVVLPAIMIGLIVSSGCTQATGPEVYQSLDETSGITITRVFEPMAFFHEHPRLAANARDYIYVGPVELNRAGRYEYVLWMSFCSTIDRGERTGLEYPAGISLVADGESMQLVETNADIGSQPYTAGVCDRSALYSVGRDQLTELSNVEEITLLTGYDTGRNGLEFRRWDTSRGFRNFARYLDNDMSILKTDLDE
jgi:hypothetical protein